MGAKKVFNDRKRSKLRQPRKGSQARDDSSGSEEGVQCEKGIKAVATKKGSTARDHSSMGGIEWQRKDRSCSNQKYSHARDDSCSSIGGIKCEILQQPRQDSQARDFCSTEGFKERQKNVIGLHWGQERAKHQHNIPVRKSQQILNEALHPLNRSFEIKSSMKHCTP
eukprot:1161966-Pelagomonas_calceolata.AAC.15